MQNDLHVAHAAAGPLAALRQHGTVLPSILYYYPVDCRVRPDLTGMLQLADVSVTSTAFGRSETAGSGPARPGDPARGLGAAFYPLPDRVKARLRFRRAHGIPDGHLVVCSVGANNPRKDLPRTIEAFARFRDRQRIDATLYLHTMPAIETATTLARPPPPVA